MIADHYRLFARYNAWANRRLYDACLALPAGEAVRQRPSFFGTIVATLNHLLVADRIWFGRIEGVDYGARRLDEVLYANLEHLYAAREDFDAHIIAVTEAWDDRRVLQPLRYTNLAGDAFEQPLQVVLAHVFNHQTHHRGQVHDMLSQCEGAAPPPPLDLIFYYREVSAT